MDLLEKDNHRPKGRLENKLCEVFLTIPKSILVKYWTIRQIHGFVNPSWIFWSTIDESTQLL